MGVEEILAYCHRATALPFMVVGGNAVIAHGYARFTYDLDFLVRRVDAEAWCDAMRSLGYAVLHRAETFVQLTAPPQGIPLDLMLVNEQTFDRLSAEACSVRFGTAEAKVPSLNHLLALKLHVLRQGHRHRVLRDFDDVIMLAIKNGLDLREPAYRELFLKYGDASIYEKALHATIPGD